MTLIKEGFITAAILIIVGVGGYFAGGSVSWTALIPAIIGALIGLSSMIARKNLKAGMHMAALFALLGFLAPIGRIVKATGAENFAPNMAFYSQLITVIVCGIFLVLCIRSFIAVRKNRA